MTTHAGLWIDHRKAVVVTIADGVETTDVIESDTDRQPGRTHGVRSPAERSVHVPADDSNDRRFHGELDAFYDRVIRSVRDAESVLVMGPGEAKGELRKRLEKGGRAGRTITVETADWMTEPEIAARVRAGVPG